MFLAVFIVASFGGYLVGRINKPANVYLPGTGATSQNKSDNPATPKTSLLLNSKPKVLLRESVPKPSVKTAKPAASKSPVLQKKTSSPEPLWFVNLHFTKYSRLKDELLFTRNVLLTRSPSQRVSSLDDKSADISVQQALSIVNQRLDFIEGLQYQSGDSYSEGKRIGYKWLGKPKRTGEYVHRRLFTISSRACKNPRVLIKYINPDTNTAFHSKTYGLYPKPGAQYSGHYDLDVKVYFHVSNASWTKYNVSVSEYSC